MKKSKWIASILSVLLASSVLTACGGGTQQGAAGETPANTVQQSDEPAQPEQSAFPRMIQHVKGELVLKKRPDRIASVDIMATDYLLVLDESPIVSEGFGTKDKSPIFAKYAAGKKVTDLGGKTNLETLLEMEPDLIVISSTGKADRFEEFNKMADTVVIDYSLDAPSRLMKFAELVGKEEKAKEVIAEFNKLKQDATAAAAKHQGETALFLVSNGKDFTVIHPKNFPIFYEDIGLTPVKGLPEDGKIGGRIGIEALSEFGADHIFIAENRRQMNPDDPQGMINIWTDNPVWKNLKAVKNNQVYSVDTLVGDTFFLGQIAGLEAIKEHLGK
ncbi:ABC transporter substrate-binding protein [Paenibacillus profundus]|uniref:ABC transporter substrate-binding protein n=1 Tax=Paenibacillus profundus TaxID=1173085 RepID=A0ABS8YL01_9BACL|nr:ABC transporter substrate-binding protein [Paenibacillus profundus]MCE5171604.1 ABC transporter substrate-binding protein [Paenibacillus profundus]